MSKEEFQKQQYFHIKVAMHHLREVQPDLLPAELVEPWSKMTQYAELLTGLVQNLDPD